MRLGAQHGTGTGSARLATDASREGESQAGQAGGTALGCCCVIAGLAHGLGAGGFTVRPRANSVLVRVDTAPLSAVAGVRLTEIAVVAFSVEPGGTPALPVQTSTLDAALPLLGIT